MSELTVVAIIPAKPGSEDEVREALEALVPPTREEDGCIAYALFESVTTPGTFVTVEKWRQQTDLDAHMKSAHIASTFAKAGEHFAGRPDVHVLKPIVD